MKYLPVLFVMLSLILLTSCSKEENPFRMEMDGLLHENRQLKEALVKSGQKRNSAINLTQLLQKNNGELITEAERQSKEIEELTTENKELLVQVERVSERERQALSKLDRINQQKETVRHQKELSREQSLKAIANANKPAKAPFHVYDVMYLGKRQYGTYKQNVGRFSVRNYTDEPLTITALSRHGFARFDVPPNNTTNGVFIRAEKGGELRVKAGKHEVKVSW